MSKHDRYKSSFLHILRGVGALAIFCVAYGVMLDNKPKPATENRVPFDGNQLHGRPKEERLTIADVLKEDLSDGTGLSFPPSYYPKFGLTRPEISAPLPSRTPTPLPLKTDSAAVTMPVSAPDGTPPQATTTPLDHMPIEDHLAASIAELLAQPAHIHLLETMARLPARTPESASCHAPSSSPGRALAIAVGIVGSLPLPATDAWVASARTLVPEGAHVYVIARDIDTPSTVVRAAWQAHLASIAAAMDGHATATALLAVPDGYGSGVVWRIQDAHGLVPRPTHTVVDAAYVEALGLPRTAWATAGDGHGVRNDIVSSWYTLAVLRAAILMVEGMGKFKYDIIVRAAPAVYCRVPDFALQPPPGVVVAGWAPWATKAWPSKRFAGTAWVRGSGMWSDQLFYARRDAALVALGAIDSLIARADDCAADRAAGRGWDSDASVAVGHATAGSADEPTRASPPATAHGGAGGADVAHGVHAAPPRATAPVSAAGWGVADDVAWGSDRGRRAAALAAPEVRPPARSRRALRGADGEPDAHDDAAGGGAAGPHGAAADRVHGPAAAAAATSGPHDVAAAAADSDDEAASRNAGTAVGGGGALTATRAARQATAAARLRRPRPPPAMVPFVWQPRGRGCLTAMEHDVSEATAAAALRAAGIEVRLAEEVPCPPRRIVAVAPSAVPALPPPPPSMPPRGAPVAATDRASSMADALALGAVEKGLRTPPPGSTARPAPARSAQPQPGGRHTVRWGGESDRPRAAAPSPAPRSRRLDVRVRDRTAVATAGSTGGVALQPVVDVSRARPSAIVAQLVEHGRGRVPSFVFHPAWCKECPASLIMDHVPPMHIPCAFVDPLV